MVTGAASVAVQDPSSATYDPSKMTIRCTCPAGSAYPDVNNKLAQCQSLVPTHAPSPVPTETQVKTVR